jgi:hypothetical protein
MFIIKIDKYFLHNLLILHYIINKEHESRNY